MCYVVDIVVVVLNDWLFQIVVFDIFMLEVFYFVDDVLWQVYYLIVMILLCILQKNFIK